MKKLVLIVSVLASSLANATDIKVPCQEYMAKTGHTQMCPKDSNMIITIDDYRYISLQNDYREKQGLTTLDTPKPNWLDDTKPAAIEPQQKKEVKDLSDVPPWLR